ncbi:MAG: hypothetical protein LQ346_009067 [Caloplaca aetnensis]|nr:MAG: hypothetical protein LQ346_009067 [Caloplaca aetnensis]
MARSSPFLSLRLVHHKYTQATDTMSVSIIDSPRSIVALLDMLGHLPETPPFLYCDLEGVHLGRHGSVSLIQVFVLPSSCTFLIDVHVLGKNAFLLSNEVGLTLKSILESEFIPKVFFDVRNDADALYAHYGIRLQCVSDLQLMENGSRRSSKARPLLPKRLLASLSYCIENDACLDKKVKKVWQTTKQRGLSLFAPQHGGSYDVFNHRPLAKDIIDYCTQDVTYLPVLYAVYVTKLSQKWSDLVSDESRNRVATAQTASYDPHGKNKGRSPWAAEAGKKPFTQGESNPSRQKAESASGTPAAAMVLSPTPKPAYPTIPRSPADTRPIVKPVLSVVSNNKAIRNFARLSIADYSAPSRQQSHLTSPATVAQVLPPRLSSKSAEWTCTMCNKTMQKSQGSAHRSGKPHRKRQAAADK